MHIIVQAGGKGTRMERLTRNKPKALVPVDNLPMIFHLFKKFPKDHFVIIGDYKYSVLSNYLKAFANVDYDMVCGSGNVGTCSGLKEALDLIPEKERFLLIWCDLVLPFDYELPVSNNNIIGISKDFPCRWKFENGKFSEDLSSEFGVAGFFIFKDKTVIDGVPCEGEFVRWLSTLSVDFDEQPLFRTHEYGLFEEWDKLPKSRCRPFNKIVFKDDKVYKYPLDEQGKKLAVREANWYKFIKNQRFDNLPAIFDYSPICMERVRGKNIYSYQNLGKSEKKIILAQIIDCLKKLHSIKKTELDFESFENAYLSKTFERLEKVYDLVPFAKNEIILINGKKCRNVFFHKEELRERVLRYTPSSFCFIHGDCTFSNILLKEDNTPILIDPRGYFGKTEIFGDPAYDWAKLYYSLYSNYDQFNLKKFNLCINEDNVELNINSNGWEDMEDDFFKMVGCEITKDQMRLFLSIIWLSLTTYAWEDYDSICGAFYQGVYYLEEVL